MADLAAIAGVSAITVSRALRDSPLVNADTRARIREIARTHGYAFNVNARNLRLRRSMTVAVVVEMTPDPDRQMSGPYPMDLLGGISQELTLRGYSVLLTALQPVMPPAALAADGVILLGQGAHEEAVRVVRDWGRPLAIWGAVSRDPTQTIVGSDNMHGGALAAERFLALGRRAPVFLGDAAHGEFAERHAGFCNAFTAHGITPRMVTVPAFTVSAGAAAMESLLAAGHPPDALLAVNDLLAIGALRALLGHGLRVPEDVSVIGYDDTPLGATYVPRLSSIHQNFVEAGTLLARKVLALIEGGKAGAETLPCRLVVRDT